MTALSIKISRLEDYFKPNFSAAKISKNIKKADTYAKWFYVAATATFLITAICLILLSFPIMNILDQESYNVAYVT